MAYDFHWWVHSVLPLVFDNSLSYYEVLAKLTNYVDGLTGDVKKITDVLGTIEGIEDVTQFTEYLNRINDKIGDLTGLDTESKNNLVAAVNEAYELAKKAYVKPDGGIPEKDLSQELINKINSSGGSGGGSGGTTNYQALSNLPSINGVTLYGNVTGQTLGLGTYSKPTGGIPMDDLSTEVQNAIRDAGSSGGSGSGGSGVTDYDALTNRPQINGNTLTGNKTAAQLGLGTYNLPADGIPWSQLSEDVQTRISAGGGSGGGVTDYSALTGKPSINGHVLNSGDNDLSTLGIGTYSLPAGGIPENQLNPTLANKINQAYNGVSTNDTKFSGIASQLSNFTADRRYEAGELLYINGVMYKTKNVILAGSTLVEGNNIERATVSDEIVRLNELEQKINASSNFNSFDINAEVRMNSTIETPVKVVEGINCIGGEEYLINFYMENYNFQSGLLINITIKDHLDNIAYEHSFSARDSVNVQSITFEPTDTDTYYITAEYKANNGPAIRIYMSVKYTTSQGITYIHDMLESLEGVPAEVDAISVLVGQQQQRMDDFEDEYSDIPERVETLENDVTSLKNTLNTTLIPIPVNLLDIGNPLANKVLRSDGHMADSDGIYLSNIIDVDGKDSITVLLKDGTAATKKYSFATSDTFAAGTIVSTDNILAGSITTLPIPSNAKYFVVTIGNITRYSELVANGVASQIQYGDKIVEYNAYGVQRYYIPPDVNILGTADDLAVIELVNTQVKNFIDNVTYIDGDYSYTEAGRYYNIARDRLRLDIPSPAIIKWNYQQNCSRIYVDLNTSISFAANTALFFEVKPNVAECCIYNLRPNTEYYYRVYAVYADGTLKQIKNGTFTTGNTLLRLLYVDGYSNNINNNQKVECVANARDIGGWSSTLSGFSSIKYNLVIRCAELDGNYSHVSEKGIYQLLSKPIRVKCEIDLRNSGSSASILGSTVEYLSVPIVSYADALENNKSQLHTILAKIMDNASSNKTTIVHCEGGNDRTGTVMFLIEGILGLSESDLSKEYELSSFCGWYQRFRNSNSYPYSGMVEYIKALNGDTLAEKFETYFKTDLLFSDADISAFRTAMLN